MKITFPRFGDSHRYARLFFREIGIEAVIPSPNSRKGLERGSLLSPEEICLPFKLMVDNLISAWEKGADTVIMPATMGPCRLGEYGELLRAVLRRQGYDYRWILLDSATAIGIKELLHRLKETIKGRKCDNYHILLALTGVYGVVKKFEKLERLARISAAYEKTSGTCKNIVRTCRFGIENASGIEEAGRLIKDSTEALKKVDLDTTLNPLWLLITGEIYTCIESFGNQFIEERLMDMGIAFEKQISIGWWLDRTIINPFGGLLAEWKRNPDLPCCIGGYAKETVGEAGRYRKGGFDGIIQLLPVGCMPEIVAKSIFDGLNRDGDLPVLSVIFDEMSMEAGYVTRIEAFTDMLLRNKMMNGRTVSSKKICSF